MAVTEEGRAGDWTRCADVLAVESEVGLGTSETEI
jgi:hypothetical protein